MPLSALRRNPRVRDDGAQQPPAGEASLENRGTKNPITAAYISLLSISIGTSTRISHHQLQLPTILAAMPAAIVFVTATHNSQHSAYFSFQSRSTTMIRKGCKVL